MKQIIIIKIGRSVATTERNKLDLFRFESLAKQIILLQKQQIGVVLVVSAAVCCGEKELGLQASSSVEKQLAAGVGQAVVTAQLYEIFGRHTVLLSQLLLTKKM